MPLAAGENEFSLSGYSAMVHAGAVDVIQPDICKCGGIGAMLRISKLAEGRKLAAHQWRTRLGLIASLQAIASLGNGLCVEFPFWEPAEEIVSPPIRAENGLVQVPPRPGLGVKLRDDAVQRFVARL